LKKLEALRLPPSGQCTDREFIRRAYLDAAGILPTPEEVQKFLADSSPKKRAKLIDDLLERSEYVDYWSYKWSDLLLVSSRRVDAEPGSGGRAEERWPRRQDRGGGAADGRRAAPTPGPAEAARSARCPTADETGQPPPVLRRLADGAGEPLLRPRHRQPRLAQ